MLAVAAAHDGAFYLMGGCALKPDADGKPERVWLRDAYRFKPTEGWTRIADLPRSVTAAPSPAPVLAGRILILGGDDASQLTTAPEAHRGFPRTVLAYDPEKDSWSEEGTLPFSLVTTPTVSWNGSIVVPGGEMKPGIRSTEVWTLRSAP